MPQHVIVVPYDRTWPERAAQEAASLRRALGENCLAVHHIGSTAVDLLIEQIEESTEGETVLDEQAPRLIQRASSASPSER